MATKVITDEELEELRVIDKVSEEIAKICAMEGFEL